MSTMTMSELGLFIIRLYTELNEEETYEFYLHKIKEESYTQFKDRLKKESKEELSKELTPEQEKKQLEFGAKFIKPKKGG